MHALSGFRLGDQGDQGGKFLRIDTTTDTNVTTVRNVNQKGEATKLNDVVNWVGRQTFDSMTDPSKIENVRHNLTYIKGKVEKHNKSWSVFFHFSKKYDTSVLDQKLSELDTRLSNLKDHPLQSKSFMYVTNQVDSQTEAYRLLKDATIGTAIVRLDSHTGSMFIVSMKTNEGIKDYQFKQTQNTTMAGMKKYIMNNLTHNFPINFVDVKELKNNVGQRADGP